jgi:ATP-binding cassette, subfamily B, bacterial
MDETPSADTARDDDGEREQDEAPGEHDATGEDDVLPTVATLRWYDHAEAAATARFTAVARRLPALVGRALHLAWRAGPADTITTITLNLLSAAARPVPTRGRHLP